MRRLEHRKIGRKERRGTAAVEFAVCLPLMMMILMGMFQVGRVVEIQQVVSNAAREAARDGSLGQDSLSAVSSNLLLYLQAADGVAFGKGHTTSMISPVTSIPSGSTGYTCWDGTAKRELFTMSFLDVTDNSIKDPTLMKQLDVYQVAVQVPFSSVALSTMVPISGSTRLNVTVTWAAMVDAPFSITPNLPAQ